MGQVISFIMSGEQTNQRGDPKSQMEPFFVPWYEIELYEKPFDNDKEREEFASWLIKNMDNDKPDGHPDPGTYYWWLWGKGAT